MNPFLSIIKSDYLQRTRSYSFLITLCASLAIAYTFVPEPNANYSTIRIDEYVGYYNSAWFGYVTAIMTSIFLSLIGFYLINSSIKHDIHTRVGHIIASTPISNFNYLFSKTISNFLILLTIVFIVFVMSILLFVLYNDGFPFELFQFLKPYLLITIPAIFFISAIAVVFEVILGKYSALQNITFFFLFSLLMVFTPKTNQEFSLDIFGSKIVIHQLEQTVKKITNTNDKRNLNIGYVIGNVKKNKKFEFNGISFPLFFIVSRVIIMILSILLIVLVALVFHRFEIKKYHIKTKERSEFQTINRSIRTIEISKLPIPQIKYSIVPLLKTEFLMLIRKGNKWSWLLNLIAVLALVFVPIKTAHQMVLPILWFLQVHRISNIATKEFSNHVHNIAFTSYKPIRRLFVSQIAASIFLLNLFALPLIIRLILTSNHQSVIAIVLGSIFIVAFSAFLGMVSKGKKLFEVLFFIITYANLNSIPFMDYFGGLHQNFLIQICILSTIFIGFSILIRKKQLNG